MHCKRLTRCKATTESAWLRSLWTEAELGEDAARGCTSRLLRRCRVPDSRRLTLTVRFHDHPAFRPAHDCVYHHVASNSSALWHAKTNRSVSPPSPVSICLESSLPLRTAKVHLSFRKDLLQKIFDVHHLLDNLVLFHCSVCHERFPTLHPGTASPHSLAVMAAGHLEVYSWTKPLPPLGLKHAPLTSGCCQRCQDSLRKVANDPFLAGVATFSDKNDMDFLHGMEDHHASTLSSIPTTMSDTAERLKHEYCYPFQNATVVESMLVALSHMQIDVCHLRGARGRSVGLTSFRKNIISFPQELDDLRTLRCFWTSLEVGDIVNVARGESRGPPHRARVLELGGANVYVQFSTGESSWVDLSSIHQRIRLPWKPSDLRNQLLIFRRRDTLKDCYIADLRVRRNLVCRLLTLLTLPGTWRTDRGVEPLHLYYLLFCL